MTHARLAAGAVLLALAAACGDAQVGTPASDTAADAARPQALLVFASHDDEAFLPSLFADFTRETGIPVEVRHRDDAGNVSDVIGKLSSPQPDVLITQSVAGAWLASQEGMLRPLASDSVAVGIPGWLQDPDGYWVALAYSTVVVAYAADTVARDRVTNYASLGDPAFRGRVCLSSSSLASNTALIANLVAAHGRRPAEIVVRDWIANLAVPPFKSEAALLDAIAAGRCGYGIVSMQAVVAWQKSKTGDAVAVHIPAPAYADAVTAGVGRHARSPEAAASFIDWLLEVSQQRALAEGFDAVPAVARAMREGDAAYAADGNVSLIGANAGEAVLLSERARYR